MMNIWIYVTTILVIPTFYLIRFLWRAIKYFHNLHKINRALSNFETEPGHWLKGHLDLLPGPTFDQNAILNTQAIREKSSIGAAWLQLPFMSSLQLSHPDTLKLVTNSNAPKGFIPATSSGYKFLLPWLGDGLLTANGAKWFRNRKLLTPAFHFDILKPYVKIYNECTETLLQKIQEESDTNTKESVEIFELISLCTLDIISKCAFSMTEDIQTIGKDSEYVKTVYQLTQLFAKRFFTPYSIFNWIYKLTPNGRKFYHLCDISHKRANEVIQKRKMALEKEPLKLDGKEENRKRYVDFLDILLLAKDENGNGLTDQEIVDEVETFMFEGHDTTASGISWLLYNLARHPEIQQRAQDEVDFVFQSLEEPALEWDDLAKLPYLTRCIKESMRLHPPVPNGARVLAEPLVIAGYELPPGTAIDIGAFNVHHNSKVWGENHMDYIPDRFLPDNISKMDSHAYIPFSAGSRNCIGQVFAMNELKAVAAQVLWRYELSVDTTHEVRMLAEAVLRAENGIKLFFKERRK